MIHGPYSVKLHHHTFMQMKTEHLSLPDFNDFYRPYVLQRSQRMYGRGWHKQLLHWSMVDVFKYSYISGYFCVIL